MKTKTEVKQRFERDGGLPSNPSPDLIEMIQALPAEDQAVLFNSTKKPCGTCKQQVVELAANNNSVPSDIIAIALKWKVSFASLWWVYRKMVVLFNINT
jgi:hypothetical protein